MLTIELARENETISRNETRRRWLAHWRHLVGDLGLGGYATLQHPPRLTPEENT